MNVQYIVVHCSATRKTGKTKSTTTQNDEYKINVLQQQNEKYKGGAKNKLPPFYLSTLNHRLTAT